MSADRFTHQVIDAEFADVGDQRRGDRRGRERRAPKRKFDTLFAATLVNHVATPEQPRLQGYTAPAKLRSGVVVNVEA